MAPIYYYVDDPEILEIYELSQRLLFQAHLCDGIRLNKATEAVDDEGKGHLQTRVVNQLGEDRAVLVHLDQLTTAQVSLTESMGSIIVEDKHMPSVVEPTESGEAVVREHRTQLALPIELTDLSKRVAELELETDALAA